jgi:hypothetical protein
MAFGTLLGMGLCSIMALAWFMARFRGCGMTRPRLRRVGMKAGGLAGGCTIGVTICLLAVRWGMDQAASAVGDPFLPAFFRALSALAVEMAWGIPLYLGVGALVGVLLGFGVAESLATSCRRVAPPAPPERA